MVYGKRMIMAKATVKLTVLVTLDVPGELAGRITREDLVGMARGCCPDSMTRPGAPTGIQVSVDGFCQEEGGQPVIADAFVEHDICSECDIEFEEEGFAAAERLR